MRIDRQDIQDRVRDATTAAPVPKDVRVSFEFFPPEGAAAANRFAASLRRLAPLDPSYISVTYGAGGTTRKRSLETVRRARADTGLDVAAHLTCVQAERAEVDAVATMFWDMGVRHIVALRGDSQPGEELYKPHRGGYAYAADLVAGLKRLKDFQISVAAYPEPHPAALSAAADLDNLKRKIDAGASAAITQYFFDVDVYFRFLDRARAAGITVPIIPGILPVVNFSQVARFSARCGATIPDWLAELFCGLENEPEIRHRTAAAVAAEQCRILHAHGIDQFHFYTMNRSELTFAVCHTLGVRPNGPANGPAT